VSLAIELTRVSKRFGARQVLREIDLEVPTGSVFAFVGNNGAGKSTTIRLITALLRPDHGTVRVQGKDVGVERAAVLRQIGCLVDSPSLYPNLTPAEFLRIGCAIKGLASNEIDRVLELVDMGHARASPIATFSLGMKQRIALAHALLGRPALLVLDEPSNGLDPQGIQDIRRLLRELPERENCTVFVSSHQLDEVEKIATHVALLHEGQVLCQAPIAQMLEPDAGCLSLEIADAQHALTVLQALNYDVRLTGARNLEVHRIAADRADQLHASLIGVGARLFQSVYQKPTLEDWFLKATAQGK
jgi:ABC-2 type transport system ATP-binding protein